MKALTIWPEWAHAICYLGKDIENRSWAPPKAMIGQRIAIHAGLSLGGYPTSKSRQCEGLANMAAEAERARRPCRVGYDQATGEHYTQLGATERAAAKFPRRTIQRGAIIATVQLDGFQRARPPTKRHPIPPWAIEDLAFWWQISDVYVLPTPIPWRGCLGLWPIDKAVASMPSARIL